MVRHAADRRPGCRLRCLAAPLSLATWRYSDTTHGTAVGPLPRDAQPAAADWDKVVRVATVARVPLLTAASRLCSQVCDVRMALLVSTMILVLFFSGIVFGWTPMQLIMERQGIYCKVPGTCHDGHGKFNDLKFNLVITVAEVRWPAGVCGRAACFSTSHPSWAGD
jgi:hypothetical protein